MFATGWKEVGVRKKIALAVNVTALGIIFPGLYMLFFAKLPFSLSFTVVYVGFSLAWIISDMVWIVFYSTDSYVESPKWGTETLRSIAQVVFGFGIILSVIGIPYWSSGNSAVVLIGIVLILLAASLWIPALATQK
ncbi:MAG: hypothetical protein LUQ40_02065 [Methanomicrobiales archaeon]|nr:hypothetical protein [Methanomicrobiales archaeon]